MTDANDTISRKAAISAALEEFDFGPACVREAIAALPSVGVTEATDAPSTDDPVATMISDLSHTGELSMLYRMSIADAITELRAENARLNKTVAMMNHIMVGEIMSEEALKHG